MSARTAAAVGRHPVTTQVTRRSAKPGRMVGLQLADGTRIAGRLRRWGRLDVQVRRARDGRLWTIPTDLVAYAVEINPR